MKLKIRDFLFVTMQFIRETFFFVYEAFALFSSTFWCHSKHRMKVYRRVRLLESLNFFDDLFQTKNIKNN